MDKHTHQRKKELIEVCYYAQHCVRAGEVCHDPAELYGEKYANHPDLVVFSASREQLEKTADTWKAYGKSDKTPYGAWLIKQADAIRECL